MESKEKLEEKLGEPGLDQMIPLIGYGLCVGALFQGKPNLMNKKYGVNYHYLPYHVFNTLVIKGIVDDLYPLMEKFF